MMDATNIDPWARVAMDDTTAALVGMIAALSARVLELECRAIREDGAAGRIAALEAEVTRLTAYTKALEDRCSLRGSISQQRAALEFYADISRWRSGEALGDHGARARDVLEADREHRASP